MIRSPFFVIDEAVSPAKCDVIIKQLGLSVPSLDESSKPLKNERLVVDAELLAYLTTTLQNSVPAIQERYGAKIVNVETPRFQQHFENPSRPCETHGCESSRYVRKKWQKFKDVDLVAYVWLKDFNSGVPLDPRFELYGGKLEFPAYNFSLVPERGTMVIFPAGPHFITAVSPVLVGSLELVKIGIKLQPGWSYDAAKFPGTFTEWFVS